MMLMEFSHLNSSTCYTSNTGNWVKDNFDKRKDGRNIEITGLEDAKSMLLGTDYTDADGNSVSNVAADKLLD
jgi:hypothetical protein